MTVEGKTVSPYRKFVCWYGVKGEKILGFLSQRWCGADAEYYHVEKAFPVAEIVEIESLSCEMWLCRKHVLKLGEMGYTVTKVTQEINGTATAE